MSPWPQPPAPVPVSSSSGQLASTTTSSTHIYQYPNDYTHSSSALSKQLNHNYLLTTSSNVINGPSASNGATSAKKDLSANFWDTYEHLCALQNAMPLQSLKPNNSVIESSYVLNLNADKLRFQKIKLF